MAKKTSEARSQILNLAPRVLAEPAGNGNQIQDRGGAQEAGNDRIILVHQAAIGVSGVRNFSGYPSEEYFARLRGHAAADLYDQMRRGESQIKMCLSAVSNPIKAATWEVKPAGEESGIADREKHSDLIRHILFKDMLRKFSQFLNESLTMVPFGHSVFEVVHKNVLNHKKFGSYTGIKVLGWRSPRTIWRWHLNKKEGVGLEKIVQNAFGDLQRLVDIPSEFLMVMTLDQEGDNYEGMSMLRAAYGAWLRKQEYLVMQAIGIEKYSIPTPIGTIPEGKQNSDQVANFEAALQNFTAHEKSYILKPPGDWGIDFVGAQGKGGFDPAKVQTAIDAEDRNMVKAFIANFLELGGASSSGSWALSFDQSSFFKSAIEHIAQIIAENVNDRIIKPLVDMNFGVQEEYPTLTFSGITDEAGKELAESLEKLAQAQILIPDDDLEDHIRKRFKLSKRSQIGQRKVQAKGALDGGADATQEDDQGPLKGHNPADPNDPAHPDHPDHPAFQKTVDDHEAAKKKAAAKKPADQTVPGAKKPDPTVPGAKDKKPPVESKMSERILLSEKTGRKQIQDGSDVLHEVMTETLTSIGHDLTKSIMGRYRKASQTQKHNSANGVKAAGGAEYAELLTGVLSTIAGRALKQARREVPKAARKSRKFSFSEGLLNSGSVRFDDTFRLEDLPKEIQDKIQAKAKLLSSSQLADLEKAVIFQFQSSEGSTDSADRIEADLGDAIDGYIDGPSVAAAAGNSAAHAVNDTRTAFFFDEDTLDEIESFTFVNPDPISPICQDLAGTTFAKDDPDSDRFLPPLHHNCKSYIVPNLAGAKDNPEIDETGLKPSDPKLERYITLSEPASES